MPTDEYRLTPTILAAMLAVWLLGGFAGGAFVAMLEKDWATAKAHDLLEQANSKMAIAEALVDRLDEDRLRAFEGGIEVGTRTREVHVLMEDGLHDSYCYNVPELANVCCWTAQ